MSMLDQLFGAQPANLERALDRTSFRHQLLTKNLANVNTPGYKRQDVDFAITLDQEMDRFRPAAIGGNGAKSQSEGAPLADGQDVRLDGSSVDLEREVVEISDTELRYQMLTDMTSRYFAGLKNVIREGR